MTRWSEEKALRIKYDAAKDPHGRGDHYVWEGVGGFGMRCYRSGRRTWAQAGNRRHPETGKWQPVIEKLGVIGVMTLKDARLEAAAVKGELAKGVNRNEAKREAIADKREADALADSTLRACMTYWLAGRNCSPTSKPVLESLITVNLSTLLDRPLLTITSDEIKECYDRAIARLESKERERAAKVGALPEDEQLLQAPIGYYSGVKTAHDLLEAFGRVFRYWTAKRAGELQRAGVIVPVCPTDALMDDRVAVPQRVKSVSPTGLAKLLASLKTYEGNQLHGCLVRMLLATGLRVGVLLNCRWEYVHNDRIVIPASAGQSKVRWNKRGLADMAIVIPRTAIMNIILDELRAEQRRYYAEPESPWLFPSRESKTGHLVEEKAVTLALRRHSGVRFTLHQLRHCVATAAENLNFSRNDIAELLGHARGGVTRGYIDEQVIRHRKMLVAIEKQIAKTCKAVP
jgi:integrase